MDQSLSINQSSWKLAGAIFFMGGGHRGVNIGGGVLVFNVFVFITGIKIVFFFFSLNCG